MSADAVIKDHLTKTKNATEEAHKTTKCTIDIKYGESDATLDIYYPTSDTDYNDCPVFVYFYGGYWHVLRKCNGGSMVVPFTKAGVIVVVVGHTPCMNGKATIAKIVNECRSACYFVRQKFPSNRIFLGGHSSGGHLASCMMFTNWESCKMTNPNIAGVVYFSGYFDLEVFQKHVENETVQITDEEAKEFTPKYNAHMLSVHKECQCLFYYAEHDPDEYKKQGKDWMKALVDSDINCKYEVVPELDHFNIIDNLQFDDYKLTMEALHFIKKTASC